jgi:hypothetical protein
MITDYLLPGATRVTKSPSLAYEGMSKSSIVLTGMAPSRPFRLRISVSPVGTHTTLAGMVTVGPETKTLGPNQVAQATIDLISPPPISTLGLDRHLVICLILFDLRLILTGPILK